MFVEVSIFGALEKRKKRTTAQLDERRRFSEITILDLLCVCERERAEYNKAIAGNN